MYYDECEYYHPKDTRKLYLGLNPDQVDQLWYRVHYFQQNSLQRDANNRLERLHKELKLNPPSRTFINKRLKQRQADLLTGLQYTHELAVINGKLSGKLVHGLGGAHVRETSLTLHPLYGIPYIPASSIKGVVRNWVIQAFFNGEENELKKGNNKDQNGNELGMIFEEIFGSEDQAGQLEFFDAFVDVEFSIQPDILTVHFPKYYQDSSLPGDNQNPNPISFYIVRSRLVQFMAGLRRDAKIKSGHSAKDLLDLAVAWLEKALTELGIGSKSSSGYGYFSDFSDVTAQALLQVKTMMPVKPVIVKTVRVEAKPVKEEPPADFSPSQKMVFKIEHFRENDLVQSKDKNFFDQVIKFGEQGDKGPALALKSFWEKNGAMKADNKKQKQKIQQLKDLLEGQ